MSTEESPSCSTEATLKCPFSNNPEESITATTPEVFSMNTEPKKPTVFSKELKQKSSTSSSGQNIFTSAAYSLKNVGFQMKL